MLLLWLLLFAVLVAPVIVILFSPHLPSPLGRRVAQYAGAAVGLLAFQQCFGRGVFGSNSPAVVANPSRWMKKLWFRAPVMALVCSLTVFLSVENGLFWGVAAIGGAPSSRTLTVDDISSASRRNCNHFNTREVELVMSAALCASEDFTDLAKPGDRLIVYGKGSPFGINVERYALPDAPEDAPATPPSTVPASPVPPGS